MDIKNSYEIAANIERVFAAWISESQLVAPVTSAAVEPRVGGSFRLHTGDDENGAVMNGTFQEFEAPHHLRYTWHWGGPDEPSVVDVRFRSVDNKTIVDLTHSGLATADMVAGHEDGWDNYIRGLRALLC